MYRARTDNSREVVIMNQQDQIKRLEESNKELQRQIELQAKQIEALKAAPVQSDDERFAPYRGEGWAIIKLRDSVTYRILPAHANSRRLDYYTYQTREQAKWENKATQVRRKLQRICAVLGPAKVVGEIGYSVVNNYNIRFARCEDAEKAEEILGNDLKYLDWNSSPEAQDARKGRV